jgi:hypothetical protein
MKSSSAIVATCVVAALLVSCAGHQNRGPVVLAPGFSMLPSTNGTAFKLVIILTNAEPPAIRSVVCVTDKRDYYLIRVGEHGKQMPTIAGKVPTDIYRGVLREAREFDLPMGTDGQPVYMARDDAKHPPQIQRLLDSVSK